MAHVERIMYVELKTGYTDNGPAWLAVGIIGSVVLLGSLGLVLSGWCPQRLLPPWLRDRR